MSQVIISGYSGLVGSEVLKLLIQDPKVTSIILIGRKEPVILDKKISFFKSDFTTFPQLELQTNAFAICCLGTTMKSAGSKEVFLKIEHDMVLNFANWCQNLKCTDFHYVSALGADKSSKVFYNHVKGQVEESLSKFNFSSVYFYRPSLLLGERKEFRAAELLSQKLSPAFNLVLIGTLKKYRAIPAKLVAKSILNQIQSYEFAKNKTCIIENEQMLVLD